MTVRVGVIGTGIMGADHARQLHHWVPGATVTLVADVDADRAAAVASEVGTPSTTDAARLIADESVDAVVIASHDSTHADLVRACVAADKPVLCEKPLAPSLAEASGLLSEIGTTGADLVSLGFMRRFDQGYVAIRDLLDGGEIGRALVAHAVSRGVSSGPGATSESSVTGSSIHDLDVIPWLLRSPIVETAWFAGRQTSHTTELVDPQILLLRTADGVLTTVETYLNARYGYDVRCEVVAETGTASLAEPTPIVRDVTGGRSLGYAADWRPRFADAYRRELTAWVRTVAAGAAPSGDLATAADGVRASAVAQALIDSMHAGGAFVPVPTTPGTPS